MRERDAAAPIAVVPTKEAAIARRVLANSNAAVNPDHRPIRRGRYVHHIEPLEALGLDEMVDGG